LIPVSLAPVLSGQAGWFFAAGAFVLGIGFLSTTLGFMRRVSPASARRVLHASLIYLPALFALLLLDGIAPPWAP
jgi:protoheme IX farnesyltransferase